MSDDNKKSNIRRLRSERTIDESEERVDKEQINIARIQEALERRADLFEEEARKEQQEKQSKKQDKKAQEQVKQAQKEGFVKVELREPKEKAWGDKLKRFGVFAGTMALVAVGRTSKYPKSMSFYESEGELVKSAFDYARGKDDKEDDSLTSEEKGIIQKVAKKFGLGKYRKEDIPTRTEEQNSTKDSLEERD